MTSVAAKVILREFPDYQIDTSYDAVLARYHLKIVAKVLERLSLSVIARFMLRAVPLGVDTIEEMAHLLGLEEADLAAAGVELLRAELITQGPRADDGSRAICLTTSGRHYVEDKDEMRLLMPRQRTLHVHFDPLTDEVCPRDLDIISLEQVRKEGLFAIHPHCPRPSLGDVSFEDFCRALEEDPREDVDYDIVMLQSMREPEVEYLAGVKMFVLLHRESGVKRLAAFRGSQYLSDVSAALERLHKEGETVVPPEADMPSVSTADVWEMISPAVSDYSVAEAAMEIVARERKSEDLERQVESQESAVSSTQDARERVEATDKLRRLQEELVQARAEHDALKSEFGELSERRLEFISTEEHRPLLQAALEQATEEVLIVSPWINSRTVDNHLCTLIYNAVRRGVKVSIGYGISANVRDAQRETGVLMRQPEDVERLARIAQEAFELAADGGRAQGSELGMAVPVSRRST